ncbi:hypothetical protein D3C78_1363800 [compost metagenome]
MTVGMVATSTLLNLSTMLGRRTLLPAPTLVLSDRYFPGELLLWYWFSSPIGQFPKHRDPLLMTPEQRIKTQKMPGPLPCLPRFVLPDPAGAHGIPARPAPLAAPDALRASPYAGLRHPLLVRLRYRRSRAGCRPAPLQATP